MIVHCTRCIKEAKAKIGYIPVKWSWLQLMDGDDTKLNEWLLCNKCLRSFNAWLDSVDD